MADIHITREHYNRFQAVVKAARHEIDNISVEVIISDEKDDEGNEVWEEITEFPAVDISGSLQDWEYDDDGDGTCLDIDEDAMQPFPKLLQGYYDTQNAYAQWDADDRATRRAESGYAQ